MIIMGPFQLSIFFKLFMNFSSIPKNTNGHIFALSNCLKIKLQSYPLLTLPKKACHSKLQETLMHFIGILNP